MGFGAWLVLLLMAPVALVAQREAPGQPTQQGTDGPSANAAGLPVDPLIERARQAALQFSQKLPNFICEEHIARYMQRGQKKKALDVVTAEVIYSIGVESYRNVKVDGHATNHGIEELDGYGSKGEFGSTLRGIFDRRTDALFGAGRRTELSGSVAEVYDFQVRKRKSSWEIRDGSQVVYPAYEGRVWIDPDTARVLRIEREAVDLPRDFAMDRVEVAVDYTYTTIAGNTSLLPVHAEVLSCDRGNPECSHNIIDFRNYREFRVEHTIK
ncbi:hypothetical protein [Candidatus Korobacter versatilis]|nr:hypothetical protein [Candidatus Koribacter versatilis]